MLLFGLVCNELCGSTLKYFCVCQFTVDDYLQFRYLSCGHKHLGQQCLFCIACVALQFITSKWGILPIICTVHLHTTLQCALVCQQNPKQIKTKMESNSLSDDCIAIQLKSKKVHPTYTFCASPQLEFSVYFFVVAFVDPSRKNQQQISAQHED